MCRIGRTARAGREGTAITILEPNQENNFSRITREAGVTKVEPYHVDEDEFEQEKPRYRKLEILYTEVTGCVSCTIRRNKHYDFYRKAF